jgi:2,4-dienoyl-CoA reductase-like NADH-dependent reductase (Old Yellow Enzyme family)
MPELFEATTIRNVALANRLVRSATYEGLAHDDGSCSGRLIRLMAELAQGEVGLIITGLASVSRDGLAAPKQLRADRDEFLSGLTQMSKAVHGAGGRIVLQIAHAGAEAPSSVTGIEAMGPSHRGSERPPPCRAMIQEDISRVVRDFTEAAKRAQRAGFDGVQIHAAHGWLLSQFLSPYFNERPDTYGGSIENRARILLEIIESTRRAVGDSFLLVVKLNAEDFLEGGFSIDDMLSTAALMEECGIDAIELSGGTKYSGDLFWSREGFIENEQDEVYYMEAARRYKQKIRAPLMVVGGIRSHSIADRLVRDGVVDYVAMCRPLIREPALCKRWRSGDTRRATCTSCNLCRGTVREEGGLYCVLEKKLEENGDRDS